MSNGGSSARPRKSFLESFKSSKVSNAASKLRKGLMNRCLFFKPNNNNNNSNNNSSFAFKHSVVNQNHNLEVKNRYDNLLKTLIPNFGKFLRH